MLTSILILHAIPGENTRKDTLLWLASRKQAKSIHEKPGTSASSPSSQ
jgi:hypothetical protein